MLLLGLLLWRITLRSASVAIDLLVVVWELLEFARHVQIDRIKVRAAQLKEDSDSKQEANASIESKAGATSGTDRRVSNVNNSIPGIVFSEPRGKYCHTLDM